MGEDQSLGVVVVVVELLGVEGDGPAHVVLGEAVRCGVGVAGTPPRPWSGSGPP